MDDASGQAKRTQICSGRYAEGEGILEVWPSISLESAEMNLPNDSVLVAVKLKAHPYPRSFNAGILLYPQSSLQMASQALADFVHRVKEPRAVCHAFLIRPGALFFNAAYKGVGYFIFDGHGASHAHADAGFRWAYEIPGAVDMTSVLTFSQLSGFSGD